METKQPEQTRDVSLADLSRMLREDLRPHPPGTSLIPRLYAVIDMGRIQGAPRAGVAQKLENFSYFPLVNDPRYEQLKWHGALLVSGLGSKDDALLNEWGASSGDIISAWVVSRVGPKILAAHLQRAAFAYDADKARYLFRFYDPLITPVLHRLADKEWAQWFFGPVVAWWYPVATPSEETWGRIAGGGKLNISREIPLVLSEELWEALKSDPFPYRLLNFAEQKYPHFFEGACYGVRLAKVEGLLAEGKGQGLSLPDDLAAYVLALLEQPSRADEAYWQDSVKRAAAGKSALNVYFERI